MLYVSLAVNIGLVVWVIQPEIIMLPLVLVATIFRRVSYAAG